MSFTKAVHSPKASHHHHQHQQQHQSSSANKYSPQPTSSTERKEPVAFVMNGFPVRHLTNHHYKPNGEDGWVTAYRAEKERYFQAVLTNKWPPNTNGQRGGGDGNAQQIGPTKRKILKNFNFTENESSKKQGMLDGFYLIQHCCVEDPLDVATLDINDKNLNHIKSEDMTLFENITSINASENSLTLESFKCFRHLRSLMLSCNNIKTIRIKHGEFDHLEQLDLSFNNLQPNDVSHLGVLRNLRWLKLTGNNLTYLPDSFSKQFVAHQDGKKVVRERFPNLEELYLDKNKLKEEDSFDVLSVLKRLKRLYLNGNLISCIPKLQIFKKVHVVQEFSKSYYSRKSKIGEKNSTGSAKTARRNSLESKVNETIVKDLDRPSSEMNLHHSNTLRNSFILEEEEEFDLSGEVHARHDVKTTARSEAAAASVIEEESNENNTTTTNAYDFERKFELPFPELLYINLADNQICEDDDLIGLAAWPSLNEIILYGNPIIYNNVGFTPLIKKYLIDRLGINITRLRPLKPLKTQFLMPLREERIIETKVSKVQKFPLELRLLGLDQPDGAQQAIEYTQDRSNFSSAQSINNDAKNASPLGSHDTVGHQLNTNIPQDKKSQGTFFMTQSDHDETEIPKTNGESSAGVPPTAQSQPDKTKLTNGKYEMYKELLEIENEEGIQVPRDLHGSLRALKYSLDNPVIIRPPPQGPNRDANSIRNQARSIKTTDPASISSTTLPNRIPVTIPKLAQINEILDTLKEKDPRTEIQLNSSNANYNKHYRNVEKRYQQIKSEFNATI